MAESATSYTSAIDDLIDAYNYEFDPDGTDQVDDPIAASRAWDMAVRIIADIYGKKPNTVNRDALMQVDIRSHKADR